MSQYTQHATRITLIAIAVLLIALAALAEPVTAVPAELAEAQIQPIPRQPLTGRVFVDLNTNGQYDYGETYRAGVLVEARHINSEITVTWTDTSTPTGDYHLLLWDPGSYHLTAHCTETTGQLSSIAICWQSPSPLIVNGSGRTQNIPLPPRRLYLPITRTPLKHSLPTP